MRLIYYSYGKLWGTDGGGGGCGVCVGGGGEGPAMPTMGCYELMRKEKVPRWDPGECEYAVHHGRVASKRLLAREGGRAIGMCDKWVVGGSFMGSGAWWFCYPYEGRPRREWVPVS